MTVSITWRSFSRDEMKAREKLKKKIKENARFRTQKENSAELLLIFHIHISIYKPISEKIFSHYFSYFLISAEN